MFVYSHSIPLQLGTCQFISMMEALGKGRIDVGGRRRFVKYKLIILVSLLYFGVIFENSAIILEVSAAEPVSDSSVTTESVDITPPDVSITSPIEGQYVNSIKGKTEPNLTVSVYIDSNQGTVVADETGNWSFVPTNVADGLHSVYATAADAAGNIGKSQTINSFILDTIRPIVLPTLYPVPDAARIPTDTQVKIQFQDSSALDSANINSAIILSDKNGNVSGTVNFDAGTKQLTFTPILPLKPYTTYYVYVNPLIQDVAGNLVHPRIWSFTTDETTASNIVSFYNGLSPSENPHGNYTDNVNICSNCHSTHRGTSPKLSSPLYPSVDNYCMACHDGTNAPIPENWSTDPVVHKHDVQVSMDGSKGTSGCTSCHDPHLTWDPNTDPNTNSNSFSLRGYYKYVHTDNTLPTTSEQQLCEACHTPDVKNDSRVAYVQYSYLKQNTASGTPDSTTGLPNDYNLCLRCHDGKIAKSDISSLYKLQSGHTLKADDGSPLNGNIACADCHDTHASPNVKELKQQLGNNNIQDLFVKTTGNWDATTERIFCLKCHNNSTELYGKTIPINTAVSGHDGADTRSCSSCHGDGDFIIGAHAPKKLP
jgi:predicted CXXCH cytochrome family protein